MDGTRKRETASNTCFIISPIKSPGSETRRRSDHLRKYIVEPVASPLGYQLIRADEISEPGIITEQIIEHLITDPVVIADLTEDNANVFYELGIRHAFGRPAILVTADSPSKIPFDNRHLRVIEYRIDDFDIAANARAQLERQILAIQSDPKAAFSPVTRVADIMEIRSQGEVGEFQASVLTSLDYLHQRIRGIESIVRTSSVLASGAPSQLSEAAEDLATSRANEWYNRTRSDLDIYISNFPYMGVDELDVIIDAARQELAVYGRFLSRRSREDIADLVLRGEELINELSINPRP